ncbi:phage tail assembly chaperone G [Bacillus amyloliquefaciens]|uniref:phage tail assembly chaperone G n=1 Tax=Bacillus amyloliquefaciens TaxID=1390 RepID=UPI0039F73C6E
MGKELEITLRIDGEDTTFTQEFVPFKFKRKAFEIEKAAQKEGANLEQIENRQLNLIVEIFGNKFTRAQLENGLNAIDHMNVLYDIIGVGLLGYRTREDIEKAQEETDMGKLLQKLIEENQSLSTKQ